MTPSQRRALDTLAPRFILESAGECTRWVRQQDPEASLYLEIGFGMGASLAQSASDYPDKRFLGIEVYRPGVGALMIRLAEQGLENVRIICDDAMTVIREQLPPASLDRVLLFFPDPWPKKRHHKRRLLQHAFLDQLRPRMKTKAILHVATDWTPYAEWIRDSLSHHPGFCLIEDDMDPHDFRRPSTKYEARGTKLGHTVHDILAGTR